MSSSTDSSQDLVERTRAARGYLYPTHEYLAAEDPDFLEDYNRLTGRALLHAGSEPPAAELAAKYRELVVIGILCFRGAGIDAIVAHMRRAISLGSTRGEILEALEAAMVPGGAPTLSAGVRALIQIAADDRA